MRFGEGAPQHARNDPAPVGRRGAVIVDRVRGLRQQSARRRYVSAFEFGVRFFKRERTGPASADHGADAAAGLHRNRNADDREIAGHPGELVINATAGAGGRQLYRRDKFSRRQAVVYQSRK